jgi:hypothetical protein
VSFSLSVNFRGLLAPTSRLASKVGQDFVAALARAAKSWQEIKSLVESMSGQTNMSYTAK